MKKLVGLLGWLGVALVAAAVAIRFAKPEWEIWSPRLAVAGLVVTALYAATQWRDIARSFGGRNVRYGSMAAGGVLAFLGLLVAVNYLGTRNHKIWDLTSNQQFSLSDQTLKILGDLKQPLTVKVFFDPNDAGSKKELQDRLGLYQYGSKQITVTYVDAVKDPVQAKQYDIQSVPTTVFEYGGKQERATGGRTEQDFTNALKKLLEGKTKKVYFVAGHNEHDMEGTDQRGYAGAVSALKEDNFESVRFMLPQESKIPDDAMVLVVAGPKIDFTTAEIDAVKTYLNRGGKLLLMIDPPDKLESPPLTNLIAFAKDWGVQIGTDIVLDVSGTGRNIGVGPTYPIGGSVRPPHQIGQALGTLGGVFPITRSVTPIEGGTNGRTAQKVIETSPRSWAETDLKDLYASKQPELNTDKGDKAGPVSIAVAVSAAAPDATAPAADVPKPDSRVVVVGDSDFASNAFINAGGDRDWLQNMVNWLAQQENLIAIHAKDAGDRRIELTASASMNIMIATLGLIPLVLIGNGVWVWWKRRK